MNNKNNKTKNFAIDTLRHDSAFSQFSASAVTRLGFSIG